MKYITWRKVLFYLFFCLFFISLYVYGTSDMYIDYWKYLLFFLVLNICVFEFIREKRVRKYTLVKRKIVTLVFLFCFAIVLLSCFFPLFITFHNWNPLFRSRLIGIVATATIAQLSFCVFYALGVLHSGIRTKWFKKKYSDIIYKIYAGLGTMASITVIALFLVAFFYGSSRVDLKKATVEIGDLPNSFDNYKIVHITDLHLGSLTKKTVQKVVDMSNAQNPDIICFTGDLITYDANEIAPYKEILQGLRAKEGIFAILGNHDYATYSAYRTVDKQSNERQRINSYITDSLHWRLLLNESTEIEHKNGDKIMIAGIENLSNEKRYVSRGDLAKTFSDKEIPETVILLSHDPEIWEDKIHKDYSLVDLTLSGHTHGRQMGVRQKTNLINRNFRTYPLKGHTRKIYGMYYSNKQYLYVSNGIGSTMFHGRLAMWADVSVIELKKTDKEP